MTEHLIDGGNFVPGTAEGDPGKLEYLHNANWRGKTMVGAGRSLQVDKRACPGCLFPDARPGKWPHTYDSRCGSAFNKACDLAGIASDQRRFFDSVNGVLNPAFDPSTLFRQVVLA